MSLLLQEKVCEHPDEATRLGGSGCCNRFDLMYIERSRRQSERNTGRRRDRLWSQPFQFFHTPFREEDCHVWQADVFRSNAWRDCFILVRLELGSAQGLGEPPTEVNPVAGPARAVAAPRKGMPAAAPFGASSGRSSDKKTSVRSTGGKKQAAKKAQVVAPDKHGPTANLTGAPYRAVAEAKIRKALDSLTELDFVDTPLTDVITYLQDLHKINITFDYKVMSDAGFRTDVQITRTLRGATLRSALRLILRDLGLTYVIGDEVLLITIPEEAQNRPVTKYYRSR